MHFTEFYRRYAAHERAHDKLKTADFSAGRRSEEERRFLRFMLSTMNAHFWLTGQVARMFIKDENRGNIALMWVMQESRCIELLGRMLGERDPFLRIPEDRVSEVFACDQPAETFTHVGANALALALIFRHAGAGRTPDPASKEAYGWIAEALDLERWYCFEELRMLLDSDPARPEIIRRTIAGMKTPGQELFEGYEAEAAAVLKSRASRALLKELVRSAREMPGVGGDLWPLIQPHLERFGVSRLKQLAARAALAAVSWN